MSKINCWHLSWDSVKESLFRTLCVTTAFVLWTKPFTGPLVLVNAVLVIAALLAGLPKVWHVKNYDQSVTLLNLVGVITFMLPSPPHLVWISELIFLNCAVFSGFLGPQVYGLSLDEEMSNDLSSKSLEELEKIKLIKVIEAMNSRQLSMSSFQPECAQAGSLPRQSYVASSIHSSIFPVVDTFRDIPIGVAFVANFRSGSDDIRVLMTCKHVVDQGNFKILNNYSKPFSLNRKGWVYRESAKSDYVTWQVPSCDWASLGCSGINLTPPKKSSMAVVIPFRNETASNMMTTGHAHVGLTSDCKPIFLHTASTTNGFSGSPVLIARGSSMTCVGMHTGHKDRKNTMTPIGFLAYDPMPVAPTRMSWSGIVTESEWGESDDFIPVAYQDDPSKQRERDDEIAFENLHGKDYYISERSIRAAQFGPAKSGETRWADFAEEEEEVEEERPQTPIPSPRGGNGYASESRLNTLSDRFSTVEQDALDTRNLLKLMTAEVQKLNAEVRKSMESQTVPASSQQKFESAEASGTPLISQPSSPTGKMSKKAKKALQRKSAETPSQEVGKPKAMPKAMPKTGKPKAKPKSVVKTTTTLESATSGPAPSLKAGPTPPETHFQDGESPSLVNVGKDFQKAGVAKTKTSKAVTSSDQQILEEFSSMSPQERRYALSIAKKSWKGQQLGDSPTLDA